jgi:hypothetical protein
MVERRMAGRTNVNALSGGGGALIVMYVEIKVQDDQRVRNKRRINSGQIAFEISVRLLKDTAQEWLKAEPKTFY